MTDKQSNSGDPTSTSRSLEEPENEGREQGPSSDNHRQSVAFLAKSLSDNNRLRILLFLGEGRTSLSVIVEKLNLSQPLVSHHLKELKRSLLVKVEREGPFIYYPTGRQENPRCRPGLEYDCRDLLSMRTTF
jgi:DNA-binding transcriptional ArsR family regulator